ncbi:MAG: efflux RND transporter periplasmic adaptor subunit [Saprospiraceae bacterium]|nr:efflux RND transporter periplasmic adaptor subunit [Saprospiraceae bacterium]
MRPKQSFPSSCLLLVVIGLSSVLACKSEKKEEAPQAAGGPKKDMPVQVNGFVSIQKQMTEKLEVPGTLQPFEETEIRPEISGRLVSLQIQEGATVQKGALLAKLFDADLQAQLKKLQVQLEIAQKTLERQRELLKIQGISQQEVDLSELQVNNIKADMELVRVNISKTEIRAPYAGKLGLRRISLGAYVSPTNVLTTISQTNQLKLDFTVPEKYGSLFPKGKQIQFTVAGSRRNFTANVLAAESAVAAESRSLTIRANVIGSDPALLPGTFAKVMLNTGGAGQSIVVPSQAIIPQARGKKVVVFKGGTPEFRDVETGTRDETFVQIIDGLQVGDTVVTTGLMAIRPNSKLILTKLE